MYRSRALHLVLALVGLFITGHNGQDITEVSEVATEGSYDLELRTSKGPSFDQFYATADYPLHIFLNSKIYSEINVPSLTSNINVLLYRLFATPTNNRNDSEAADLVKDKCSVDPSIVFLPSPSNDKVRFSFDMFAFTTDLERVYLHADTFLCHQSSPDARCSSTCVDGRVRKAIGDTSDVPLQNFQLMMGPFIKADLIAAHQRMTSQDASSDSSDLVLLISGFAIIFIIVAAFLYVECRVSKLRGTISRTKGGYTKEKFDNDEFMKATHESFENNHQTA